MMILDWSYGYQNNNIWNKIHENSNELKNEKLKNERRPWITRLNNVLFVLTYTCANIGIPARSYVCQIFIVSHTQKHKHSHALTHRCTPVRSYSTVIYVILCQLCHIHSVTRKTTTRTHCHVIPSSQHARTHARTHTHTHTHTHIHKTKMTHTPPPPPTKTTTTINQKLVLVLKRSWWTILNIKHFPWRAKKQFQPNSNTGHSCSSLYTLSRFWALG